MFRLQNRLIQRCNKIRYLSTALPNEEYTATPQYPEILDLSHEKVAQRKKEAEYEAIKAVKTIEEKQIKLNMPKFYGFKCYMLREDYIPYNNLPLIQHVTRTHLIRTPKLPNYYNDIQVASFVNAVKNDLNEVISMELEQFRQINDLRTDQLDEVQSENLLTCSLTRQINRVIVNNLSRQYPHLHNIQIDLNPRIESFWYAGGMNPPENIKKCKRGCDWRKNEIDAPTNRVMNYTGSANIALRSNQPLRPVISLSESENPDLTIPDFHLDPRTVGTTTEHRHLANIPGFWPGDPNQFGLVSYHQRGHFLTRHYNDLEDHKEAVERQGILSSFGWLNAQATFLGFTTFNDITYPLVTQTVVTNGQLWSFFVYQLNTLLVHSGHITTNPHKNICWATPELKLYEDVVDGKIVGLNEEVLEMLLKVYANAPEERLGINMTPFLGKEEKVCADYEDDEKREWLEREYKFLMANRPRLRLPFEVYAWEKIYKIDHQTKFLDKKRRPYEFGIKPWDRTLDKRLPRYIPRAHRPDVPRWKGRYAKEYFP